MGTDAGLRWGGAVPLARHRAFSTDDPEVAVAAGTDLLGPHRLGLPAGLDGFAARVNALHWRDVMLAYFSYGVELQVASSPLSELYAVNLPLTGHADVRYRGAEVHSSPHDAVVFSTPDASDMRWSADHTVLCVTIRRTALDRHLSRMLGRQVDGGIDFAPAMSMQGSGTSWGGVVQTLLDVAERSRAGTQSPLLAAELENMVMTTLLLAQPHSYSDELLDEQPAASTRTVRQAIEVMHSQPAAGLTVPVIAEQVGVSERSLQSAFRSQLGTSPSAYLRDMRLERAHDALLATSPQERSVSQIGVESGFVHLGRFARTYRERFGENPSQTIRRRGLH